MRGETPSRRGSGDLSLRNLVLIFAKVVEAPAPKHLLTGVAVVSLQGVGIVLILEIAEGLELRLLHLGLRV